MDLTTALIILTTPTPWSPQTLRLAEFIVTANFFRPQEG